MARCSECGATLPEEIDKGTGVYCDECGHGQMVTDGGQETRQRREVTYRVWCEHEGCDFEREGSAKHPQLAQREANAHMVGHGLVTDHHETYRSVDTEGGRDA